MKNRRGQITIFVIIGLVLLVSILLGVSLVKNFGRGAKILEDPGNYIDSCIKENLERAENMVIEGNLYPLINITNGIIFYGEGVPFLCKVSEFYYPCTPQETMLFQKVESDIVEIIREEIDNCFEDLKYTYEKSGYNVDDDDLNISIEIRRQSIKAFIKKQINIEKEGESSKVFNEFTEDLESPLYGLLNTARNVVNYESTNCEFNQINWMLYYPNIKISKYSASDQTKIYTILDRITEKEIKIAVKTCVLPAGI